MSITALKLEMIDPKILKKPEREVRGCNDAQVIEMVASIQMFGFVSPILVTEDYTIISGFVRQAAALKMQLAQVPVLVASGFSKLDAISYQIVENRLGENSSWLTNEVQVHLHNLDDTGQPVRLPGFNDEEFEYVYESLVPFFDDVPLVRIEKPAEPISEVHIRQEIMKLGAPLP